MPENCSSLHLKYTKQKASGKAKLGKKICLLTVYIYGFARTTQ